MEVFPDELEAEISVAARSGSPVLITAPPGYALSIVRAIAARDHRGQAAILTCDSVAGDDVITAIADNTLGVVTDCGSAILWLKEVHALKSDEQAAVMDLIARQPVRRNGEGPRIVTSSSVDLFDRVAKGLFDAGLFYRLNTIHIVVLAPLLERRPS